MIQKKYLLLFLFILIIAIVIGKYTIHITKEDIIKVGIIHSLTGPLAQYEEPVVKATMLAIEEINNKGGVLGKKIVPIIRDGKSEASQFEKEATDLITHEKVVALFGCWSSQDR